MEKKDNVPHINVDFFEGLTGDISGEEKPDVEGIGIRIRTLREEKGLSIEALSNLTGFDIEFLSDIENQNIQPQLGTIIKLSKALDSAFSRLVSGVGDKLYSVTRKKDQKTVSRSTSRKGQKKMYAYKSLAPEVKGRHMEALMVQLEEDPEEEVSVHEGEEFIFVLEGRHEFVYDGRKYVMEKGDSVYFDAAAPHSGRSLGKKRAKILLVMFNYKRL